MLLRPCLPQMKTFCWESAHLVMALDMASLTAAAMALLSVFWGAEWSGVLGRSLHTVKCVVVGCAFREQYSERVIEAIWGLISIHHRSHRFVKDV